MPLQESPKRRLVKVPSVSAEEGAGLRVRFGAAGARLSAGANGLVLDLPVPHLAGPGEESGPVFSGTLARATPESAVFTGERWLAAAWLRPITFGLRETTCSLYRDLFEATSGWNLARVWNYVPCINEETAGLENYRHFNLGRWQAYHEAFGEALASHLPAASAVGVEGDHLVTVCLATRGPVRRVENPLQVPAWQYPAAYGPRAPVFVRAVSVADPLPAAPHAWLSGTASIRGHETLHAGEVARQLEVTVENIARVLEALGRPPVGHGFPKPPPFIKVYLRHADDLPAVRSHLAAVGWPATGPGAPMFLRADICRPELALEIELAFTATARE